MQQAIRISFRKRHYFQTHYRKIWNAYNSKRPQGFETLVLLILEQQVSIDSAKATFLKLKTKEDNFRPEILLYVSDEEFRNLGVSRQKTTYIKALSTCNRK